MEIVTLLRRIIYVFGNEDFSRHVILCFGTFDLRFNRDEIHDGTRCTVTKPSFTFLATKIFPDKLLALWNVRSPFSAARFTLCRAQFSDAVVRVMSVLVALK